MWLTIYIHISRLCTHIVLCWLFLEFLCMHLQSHLIDNCTFGSQHKVLVWTCSRATIFHNVKFLIFTSGTSFSVFAKLLARHWNTSSCPSLCSLEDKKLKIWKENDEHDYISLNHRVWQLWYSSKKQISPALSVLVNVQDFFSTPCVFVLTYFTIVINFTLCQYLLGDVFCQLYTLRLLSSYQC